MKPILRILTSSIFILLFFYFSANSSFAQSEKYDININSNYKINEEGTTNSSNTISVNNKTKYDFMSTFAVKLQRINDIRNIKAYYQGSRLQTTFKKDNDDTIIEVNLGKRLYGENKTFEFSLDYETSQMATKTGDHWEVFIPTMQNLDQLSNYLVSVQVPETFGKLSISKPREFFAESNIYKYSKNNLGKAGIYMLFGSSQTYSIYLSYHISNSNLFPIKSEVAIPPSTNYQDILINNISPKPQYIYEDIDGNWLAIYSLNPKEKIDIKTNLIAKVYSGIYKSVPEQENKSIYTKEDKFWEVNDIQIKKLSKNLKTPYQTYDFVIKSLNYNYNKIIGENTRLGAKGALLSPNSALCLEFTDLFIALARASGIPARAVEGYAYSQNSKLKPLSILKDTLHTWPEYYDSEKQSWVMIDPTWGSTTGGSDYFTSLDLSHIAFVIKGTNSQYPVSPGGYKNDPGEKDINVNLADSQEYKIIPNISVSDNLLSSNLPFLPIDFNITLKNNGNSQIKDEKIYVSSDLFPKNLEIDTGTIPPYGYKSYQVKLAGTSFLTNKVNKLNISFKNIAYSKNVSLGIDKKILYLLIGGGFVASVILSLAANRRRRLHI